IAVAHIRSGGRNHTVEVAISRAPSRAAANRQASVLHPAARAARARARGPGAGTWSAPSVLGGCALPPGPRVAFPSQGPAAPTGPGAIAWASSPSCDPASALSVSLSVAALGAPGRATTIRTRSLVASAAPGLASVGGPLGR